MVTEESFVSFDLVFALIEKGFVHRRYYGRSEIFKEEYFPVRPTLSVVMKWLRDEYGLFVMIGCDDLDWWWQIYDVRNRDENRDPICLSDSNGGISTYEEAAEGGIRYVLDNLNELVTD